MKWAVPETKSLTEVLNPLDASHPLALALCLGLRRGHRLKNNAATDRGKGHAIARPSAIITTPLPWILNKTLTLKSDLRARKCSKF